mgnify:CR=1 FL=1
MSKVAIVTDSNSGISINENDEDLYVLPMPFLINEAEYFEEVSLSQKEFYEKLKNNANISTSQPSPFNVTDIWDKALETHDELVYIPMSSGLSESCNTAKNLAKNYNNKVYVVNNQRISVTQKESVYEALKLAKQGKTAKEIKDILKQRRLDSSIYITVATLSYLKKGGRITPAAAILGSLLNIKPILQIHGGKLDAYAKVLSFGQAKMRMINAIKKDLETVFKEYYDKGEMVLEIAHTNIPEEAEKFKQEIQRNFPNMQITYIDPLSLSVACHIGPGSLAIATTRVIK